MTLSTESRDRLMRRLGLMLRVAVPVVLLLLLWRFAQGAEAMQRIGNLAWGPVIVALLSANLQIVLSALRWRIVSRELHMPITLRHAIGEYYFSQLVNQTVPGGVVGDASRAVRARQDAGIGRAALAVVIERGAGQVALFGVFGVGLAYALLTPGGVALPSIPAPRLTGMLAIVTLIVAALVIYRLRPEWPRAFGRAVRLGLLSRRVLASQAGLSLAIVACNLATFALCAAAVGAPMSLEAIAVIVPLILMAMLVPASIAGWGVREGAAAALFPLTGMGADAGLAASIVFGVVVLLASLPGIAALWSGGHCPTKSWRSRTAPTVVPPTL